MELRYFRDVDKREVDFVIVKDGIPIPFIECKRSKTDVDLGLRYLKRRFSQVTATQAVLEGNMDFKTREDIRVCSAHHFLKDFA